MLLQGDMTLFSTTQMGIFNSEVLEADAVGSFSVDPLTGKLASASRLSTPYELLYSEDFNSSMPAEWAAYNGASISINSNTSENYAGSVGSLKATYPQPTTGEVYVVGNYDLTPYCALGATNHIYVDFYAKMPASKQGLKFLKLFGARTGGNYANTTFGLDYTGEERGGLIYVGFGDGTFEGNDTANGIWLDGSNSTISDGHGPGRSEVLPGFSVSTPQNAPWLASNWGTTWHRFQLYIKFNSGTSALNEVNDGEMDVIIDGVTWVSGRGLLNRHYTNGPLESIHFFDYSQTGTAGFELWVDSIRISQGGWTR